MHKKFQVVLFCCLLGVSAGFTQPEMRLFNASKDKEIILEKYTSRLWLKTKDKKRYTGYLLEYTTTEYVLLDFAGSESGLGMSERKRKMKQVMAADSLDSRQKHIEYLKLYHTDTLRIPADSVIKLEAEKPFYREHKKLVTTTGITGIGLLIISGLLSNVESGELEVPATIGASTGGALLLTWAVMTRHYHVNMKSGNWEAGKLK